MKVLICDDEYHVIQAIRLLVPWKDLGINQVFTTSNGADALILIEKEAPEIVITDIVMENTSGLDIMNYIAEHHPATRVIAVSGHNDFDYVRTMLTKGCVDYLLKPLEASTLISAINKAVSSWNTAHESSLQHRHLQERLHTLSTFHSGMLLFHMLNSRTEETACQELLQSDTPLASAHTCQILYYNTDYLPLQDTDFQLLLQNFEDRVRQLTTCNGLLLTNPNQSSEHIIFIYNDISQTMTTINRTAQSFFLNTTFPFCMGLSPECSFPHQFPDAWHKARTAFFSIQGNKLPSSIIIPSENGQETPIGPLDLPHIQQLEDQILSALFIGEKPEIEFAISHWLECVLPTDELPLRRINDVLIRFTQLVQLWIAKIQKQNMTFLCDSFDISLTYADLTNEDYLFSRLHMQAAMVKQLFLLCDKRQDSRSSTDIMYQIANYMEVNYTHPFIQAEYAKQFYINKDYMCRKFTNVFGVNMLTYLNQIRIRHAKELLGDPSLKIQDIAYRVGFKDEKYFAKQFKKLTNTTPGDYRASLKQS